MEKTESIARLSVQCIVPQEIEKVVTGMEDIDITIKRKMSSDCLA